MAPARSEYPAEPLDTIFDFALQFGMLPIDRLLNGRIEVMKHGGDGDRNPSKVAMDSCQRAVEDRVRRDGYQHVDFLSINVDDRPGRSDWIVGTIRADIRLRSDSFSFSCSVDLHDGDVRSVDVRRR